MFTEFYSTVLYNNYNDCMYSFFFFLFLVILPPTGQTLQNFTDLIYHAKKENILEHAYRY